MKINCNTMTTAQARALARHFSELVDVQTTVNNTLIGKLCEALEPPITSETVNHLLSTINEWSAFLNRVTDESNVEVCRILGIKPSNPTLQ